MQLKQRIGPVDDVLVGTRQMIVTAMAALLAVGCPTQAQARPAPTVTSSTAAQDAAASQNAAPRQNAQARAARAAARVRRLTKEYRRHSADAATAASALTDAYRRVETAEQAADASRHKVVQAHAELADRAFALYVLGTSADSKLTLLTADSPEDGLWRLAIGTPVGERLLIDGTRREQAASTRATADETAAKKARSAVRQLGRLLRRLRDDEANAGLALDAARTELKRLDDAARREQAARRAATELAQAQNAAMTTRLRPTTSAAALAIPAEFERAYRDAAPTCPGLSWTLLAAVGQVESGHGRNPGPSSAGAIGPMQFMPATFADYAVDGDGDGTKDAWDPQDAVFSAARYLCASGAGHGPDGVRRALLSYNHAQWYVDLVLSVQQTINAAHPS
jgi:hypothetical protein